MGSSSGRGDGKRNWEKNTLDESLRQKGERDVEFSTVSGMEVERL